VNARTSKQTPITNSIQPKVYGNLKSSLYSYSVRVQAVAKQLTFKNLTLGYYTTSTFNFVQRL